MKVKDTPVVVQKEEQPATSLFPSLSLLGSGRAAFVSQAERLFGIIKRGIKHALVTGLIVALVKLAPLIWVGLRVSLKNYLQFN